MPLQITARFKFLGALLLVTVIPLLLYVAVTLYWQANHYYPLTGDEPHYLLTADSIVRDHDLRVTNNYQEDTPVSSTFGKRLDAGDRDHVVNNFSVHGIGLPLIIAPAYAVGGVFGAKLFLAFLIGIFLPLTIFQVLEDAVPARWWNVLVTLAFVCSLPFLAGSNQIYTDLIAGILILRASRTLIKGAKEPELGTSQLLVLGIEIAFLPWLYKRYIPIAFVLLAALVWITLSRNKIRWQSRALLLCFSIVACSWLALALFQTAAFGNPFGFFAPDQIQLGASKVVMTFAGLHWDSLQGLFAQNPLLWLALIGVIPLWRENPRGGLIWVVVYLAAMLPGAINSGWYGNASFVGRYTWVGVGLWIFPLAMVVRLGLQSPGRKLVLGTLCVASLVFQLALARVWLSHDHFLDNHGIGAPIWTIADLYTPLLHLSWRAQYLLPSFRDPLGYLTHLPNYLAVALCVLLVASGAWLSGVLSDRRILGVFWSVWVLCAVLIGAFYAPASQPSVYKASRLPGMVGDKIGDRRVAVPGQKGLLIYGPYIEVFPGRAYSVTVKYMTSAKAPATYDLALDYGKTILAQDNLPSAQTNGGSWSRTFAIPPLPDGTATPSLFEFRVFYKGRGDLQISQVEFQPQ